jgi:sialidase-1
MLRNTIIGIAFPILCATAQAQTPFSTTVFTGSVRIPALEVGPDGSLLAFIEERPAPGGDPGDGSRINIQFRRSTDNGRTWSTPAKLFDGAGAAHSDSRPIVDRMTGKVFLFCARWGITCGQNSNCPTWSDTLQDIRWRESLDSGKTWSTAQGSMKAQLGKRPWRSLNVTPGRGIQLQWQTAAQGGRNGRLVLPNLFRDSTGNFFVSSLYSDDHGKTWAAGSPAPGPGDESDMVELTDGRLLLSTRGGGRTWFLSPDGGATWTKSPTTGISITAVDCSIGRLSAARSGEGRDRLVFSGPIGTGRTNLGLWMSYDEGKTWQAPKLIASGAAGYSALVLQTDGTLGILYEGNAITYMNLARAFIEPGTRIAPVRAEVAKGRTDPFAQYFDLRFSRPGGAEDRARNALGRTCPRFPPAIAASSALPRQAH